MERVIQFKRARDRIMRDREKEQKRVAVRIAADELLQEVAEMVQEQSARHDDDLEE